MSTPPDVTPRDGPPLMQRFRHAAHEAGHSAPTVDALAGWVRTFILFHDKRHPDMLDRGHVAHYLDHVVRTEPAPLPALEMAHLALTLLYRTVLGIDLGELPQPRPPRLLDQVAQVLRLRHYSAQTEKSHIQWARRFFRFHQLRHPRTMGTAEVEQFLTHLAIHRRVSASTTTATASFHSWGSRPTLARNTALPGNTAG